MIRSTQNRFRKLFQLITELAMQLMRLADVPLDPHDRVFYYSRLHAVIGATLLDRHRRRSIRLCLVQRRLARRITSPRFSSLCLLIFQRLIIARFRSSNWLLRMTDHGLFVKFRSYLNIT